MNSSKGKFAVLLIIITIICVILGIIYFSNHKKVTFHASFKSLYPISYEKNIEISLGEEVPTAKDYSEFFENEIVWFNDVQEKVSKKGIYQGFVISGYWINPIVLTVVDKNPPSIQNVKDITTYVGESLSLEEQVKIIDDSKEEIKAVVKGEYSFEKEGVYPLSYEATDSSRNTTSVPFQLIVKKKETPKSSVNSTDKKSSKGYSITYQNGAYYVKGILIANKTYSLSSKYAPGGLTKETNVAFEKMKKDALKEGIHLKIISGYRSYSHQQTLYNNYVKRDGKKAADRYSARPGYSEHQTGLAFDVNSLEQSFGNTKEGKWLSDNCYKYGFVLRYPKGKETITGYMYEPWHFRYIGEEAKSLYNNGNWLTLEEYLGIDSEYSS